MNQDQKINSIIGGAVIVVIILSYLFAFNPLWKKNQIIAEKTKVIYSALVNIKNEYNDQKKIDKSKERIQEFNNILKERIPEKISISQLNEVLIRPVDKTGVIIESMLFGLPKNEQENINFFSIKAEYIAIDIELALSGTTRSIIEYIKAIKRQKRYISIEKILIFSNGRDEGFRAKLNLKAYSIAAKNKAYEDVSSKIKINKNMFSSIENLLVKEKAMIKEYKVQIISESDRTMSQKSKASFRAQNFNIQGVVVRKPSRRSVAIISGEILREGDAIRGYKVIKIEGNGVLFERNKHIYELKITKEGG